MYCIWVGILSGERYFLFFRALVVIFKQRCMSRGVIRVSVCQKFKWSSFARSGMQLKRINLCRTLLMCTLVKESVTAVGWSV